MYEIEVSGRKLNYKILYDVSEFGETYETVFFDKIMVNEKRWSWRKFKFVETGKLVEEHKTLFCLYFDLHDAAYTKKDIRNRLQREVELLSRAEEIERGEII